MASPWRRCALLFVVLTFLSAAPARAADCPTGATCGSVTVPLDHSGATPGTLGVAYARLPATGTRTGTLVFLAGGPGQAAIPFTNDFAALLKPLRSRYDIVAVDQRGTGDSDAVACDQISKCPAALGARRPFWNTPETARDLEDLRVALGVDKLTLYAVSYGTNVAADYARLYPQHTAAIVLDSPTPVDGLDGVDALRTFGTPRVLREVCFPGLCHRTVTDPDAALTAAVKRLDGSSIGGPVVSTSGKVSHRAGEPRRCSTTRSPRATSRRRCAPRCPAAIASLADGDAAPFLHALELDTAGVGGGSGDINEARLLATTCIESRLPWAPDSPVASRQGAMRNYITQHADAFGPFSPEVVLSESAVDLCAAVAADARAGAGFLRRPGPAGARDLRPPGPAHAAGERVPDRRPVPARDAAAGRVGGAFGAEHRSDRLRAQRADRVPERRDRCSRATRRSRTSSRSPPRRMRRPRSRRCARRGSPARAGRPTAR